MNMNQFTQKSIAAIQRAQQLATEYQNTQVTQAHLLCALLEDKAGLIPNILKKMGVSVESAEAAFLGEVEKQPKVMGQGREMDKIYIDPNLEKALIAAEEKQKQMKDEYLSLEHMMLGLLEKPDSACKAVFSRFAITKEAFLGALTAVRGNARVTTDSPEDTYEALQKYGTDLVELARQRKLDPVIGRDEEIRNVIRILSRKTKNNPCLIGTGRGQNRHCRGLGAAHRARRRA